MAAIPAAIPRAGRVLTLDCAPALEEIRNAVVTPTTFRLGRQFSGEVRRPDGTWCDLSLRPSARATVKHVPLEGQPAPDQHWPGTYLYVGPLFEQFGHDLTELTGRLWPLIERSYDGVIAQIWRHHSTPLQASWSTAALEILSAFGIRHDQIRIPTTPVSVERVDVPEGGWRINDCALPIMRECFRRLSDRLGSLSLADAPDSVFFSRARLPGPPRSPHEAVIEALACELGMAVLHPQNIAFGSQIAVVKGARVIAGIDGSALHLAAFCRPGTTVLSFDTRNVENQYVMEALLGLDGVHVDVRSEALAPAALRRVLESALARHRLPRPASRDPGA